MHKANTFFRENLGAVSGKSARFVAYAITVWALLFPELLFSRTEAGPVRQTPLTIGQSETPGETSAPRCLKAEDDEKIEGDTTEAPSQRTETWHFEVKAFDEQNPIPSRHLRWDPETGQRIVFDENANPSLILSGNVLTAGTIFIGDTTKPALAQGPFRIVVPLKREPEGVLIRVKESDWNSQFYLLQYSWLRVPPLKLENVIKDEGEIISGRMSCSDEEPTANWLSLSWPVLTDEEEKPGAVAFAYALPSYQDYQLNATNLTNGTHAALSSAVTLGVDLEESTFSNPSSSSICAASFGSFLFHNPCPGLHWPTPGL